MKIEFFVVILFFCTNFYAQDCSGFSKGRFEYQSVLGTTITVERFKNYQLESDLETGNITLLNVEKVSDCEYYLSLNKIIVGQDLPEEAKKMRTHSIIYKVENDVYYSRTNTQFYLVNEEFEFRKISTKISKEFKALIRKIK